jgi:HlyD family secretion protein
MFHPRPGPARLNHLRVLSPLTVLTLATACSHTNADPAPRLEAVQHRDITVTASAAGVVEPVTMVEVKSKASGEIVEVLVEEGDHARRGQLLVRVDQRVPMNAVVQARADSVVARAELDNAAAQLTRAETLHQTDAITDLEFEAARLNQATAEAALIRARRALEDARIAFEDTEVRAPADGVILGRNVEVGSVIASASREIGGGAVLLRMASLDTVQVRALVDETDIGMIRPGLPVRITVAAYPNRPFAGEVRRIAPEAEIDQNVTMFPVLMRIPNHEGLLRPGMNAEVEIQVADLDTVLAVPNAALRPLEDDSLAAAALGVGAGPTDASASDTVRPATVHSGGGARVAGTGRFGGEYLAYVRRGGAPEAVRVRTGLTDYDFAAVLSGLQLGDSVYVLPTGALLSEQQEREQRMRQRAGGALGQ